MNRRHFLRSVVALAAIVSIPATAKAGYGFLSGSEMQRFLDMAASGVVRDQIFLLDHPITIDFDNLIIYNCTFIKKFSDNAPMITLSKACRNIKITTCFFAGRPASKDGVTIGIETD